MNPHLGIRGLRTYVLQPNSGTLRRKSWDPYRGLYGDSTGTITRIHSFNLPSAPVRH